MAAAGCQAHHLHITLVSRHNNMPCRRQAATLSCEVRQGYDPFWHRYKNFYYNYRDGHYVIKTRKECKRSVIKIMLPCSAVPFFAADVPSQIPLHHKPLLLSPTYHVQLIHFSCWHEAFFPGQMQRPSQKRGQFHQ